jgi:hypothetical protein
MNLKRHNVFNSKPYILSRPLAENRFNTQQAQWSMHNIGSHADPYLMVEFLPLGNNNKYTAFLLYKSLLKENTLLASRFLGRARDELGDHLKDALTNILISNNRHAYSKEELDFYRKIIE